MHSKNVKQKQQWHWWWQFDWSFAHLTAPVVSSTSIILTSLAPIESRMEILRYRLTQVHLKMAVKMEREWQEERSKSAKILTK